MGSLCFWTVSLKSWASVLSRTLLTLLMGALGSVFGPLAQSADRLTHQEGKHGPAVGCGWGQTISLVTLKNSHVLQPITDAYALSPFQVEVPTHPSRIHSAVTSSRKPSLISRLGYPLPQPLSVPAMTQGFVLSSCMSLNPLDRAPGGTPQHLEQTFHLGWAGNIAECRALGEIL